MAAKIKDGLFIGDAETSTSEVFINDNKISNLVNLSAKEVHNAWAAHGLVYLSYNWDDRPDYKLFSGHDDPLLTDIVEFVDVSISHGISVLMFSRNGTGRCVVAACVYLMMKYRWGFEKTYDYVYSKKPDIDLNKGFIQQMFALDMKLLAARQKLQASRMGIENTFKIEANMTINDISAMLPPMEAQRWNSWNSEYLLVAKKEMDAEGAADHRQDSKSDYKHRRNRAKSAGGLNCPDVPQAPEDLEEEMVLVCSYTNSKNTISSLPGPYPLAMDVPKNFKLKFNRQRLTQFEDEHMFPTEPPDVRVFVPPRGVLKGSRENYIKQQQAEAAATAAAAAADAAAAPKHVPSMGAAKERKDHGSKALPGGGSRLPQTQSSARSSIDMASHATSHTADPAVANESDVQYSGGGGNRLHGANSTRPAAAATGQSATAAASGSDLYGFVGMESSQTHSSGASVAYSQAEPTPSAAEPKHRRNPLGGSGSNQSSTHQQQQQPPMGPTAEERLRVVMEDMQRKNLLTKEGSTPSLYDLAHMQVSPSAAGSRDRPGSAQRGHRSGSGSGSGGYMFSMEDDDELDAMLPIYNRSSATNTTNPTGHGSSSSAGRHSEASSFDDFMEQQKRLLMASNSRSGGGAGSSGGGVRARHDIVLGGRPASARPNLGGTAEREPPRQPQQAWGSSGNGPRSRPASPSQQRPASPSSARGGTSRSMTSNLSVSSINSDGSSQQQSRGSAVGSGAGSGQRVYRHGSPAPNTSRTTATGRSSSGRSGLGVTGSSAGGRSSAGAQQPPALSSYSLAMAIQQQQQQSSRRSASPSGGSVNSDRSHSSAVDPRRRTGGTASPMRGSGSAPSTSKRYSTPTPQSGQHHDYDRGSTGSLGVAGQGIHGERIGTSAAGARASSRSSTPTKSWRF